MTALTLPLQALASTVVTMPLVPADTLLTYPLRILLATQEFMFRALLAHTVVYVTAFSIASVRLSGTRVSTGTTRRE